MASNIPSRNRKRSDDLHRSSSLVKKETLTEIETNADQDAYQLYAEFNCTFIHTPRIFHDYRRSSTEMENALDGLISQVSTINKTRNEEKADGSAVSFMGGLLGIGGTVAAPFTLGGSLVLAGTGIAMSIGGSCVSSKAATRMTSEIDSKLQVAKALIDCYNEQISKWTIVAQLLSEIVEDLQKVFNGLAFSFAHLVGSIENVKHDDKAFYGADCILKCVSTFYGVAKQSTHVVKNVEHIARLSLRVSLRVRQVRTVSETGKKVGEVLKVAKGAVLQTAIGKPQFAFSATKQVLDTGRQVISTVEKQRQVAQTVKMVSTAVDGTGKVVNTERVIQAVGTSITKETAIVTKNVFKLSIGLGVVFAAVDLYQFDQAKTASKATCDAEKELRSCKENIKRSTNEIMAQVETFKQVMKIKAFFQSLLKVNKPFLLVNVSMHFEQVRACIVKIDTLCQMMS